MSGALRLAAVFGSHMILQRDKHFSVWGEGADGTEVTVRVRDTERSCVVRNGRWSVALPPQEVGEPCVLTVSGSGEELRLEDVLFGDVWLAGGQSNMEWPLRDAKDGQREIDAAQDNLLRFYNVPRCPYTGARLEEAERGSRWQTGTGDFSAVAYWFSKEIRAETGVPVGIVGCNWGGTSAAAWMSRERLSKIVSGRRYIEDYMERGGNKSEEEYERDMVEYNRIYDIWKEKSDAMWAKNPKTPWREIIAECGENPWPQPPGPSSPFRPNGLYETMLSRVAPLALKGFLYYQGEEDWSRSEDYYDWMCALIGQWREDFKDDSLPFLFVQLPMYDTTESIENGWVSEDWPRLREAQLRVSRFVRNTGLAVVPDCGELDNIHPTDKEPVGHRLALQALKNVYGKAIEADGPSVLHFERSGSEVRVIFDQTLELRGNGLFELAGGDGIFYACEPVKVEKDTLVLSAKEVFEPCAVRYAWRAYCVAQLYGINGLPASPFRGTL